LGQLDPHLRRVDLSGVEFLDYQLTKDGLTYGNYSCRPRRFELLDDEGVPGACHVAWRARDLDSNDMVVLKAHHNQQPQSVQPTKDACGDVMGSMITLRMFDDIKNLLAGAALGGETQ